MHHHVVPKGININLYYYIEVLPQRREKKKETTDLLKKRHGCYIITMHKLTLHCLSESI